MADEDLRALERAAANGDASARVRFRRAWERSAQSGLARGLAVGDRVRVRSCLPGPPRIFEGRVTGVGPDGVPLVEAQPRAVRGPILLTMPTEDVTGCPRCEVTLLDPASG